MRIRVRALPGRIVNTAPRGGRRITTDLAGEVVDHTAWIQRAITVHGDLVIVEPKPSKKTPQGDAATPKPLKAD